MDFDATDWPHNSEQAVLCQLDVAASCNICHGPYDTALSLPCGHSFCAECIRSNIEFQERSAPSRCPQCRERCDTRELRQNHSLQGLVQSYAAARQLLTALARTTAAKPAKKQQARKGYQTRSKEASVPLRGNNARGRSQPAKQSKSASAPSKRKRSDISSSSSGEPPLADQPSPHSQSAVESDYRPSQPAGSMQSEEGSSDIDEPGDGEELPGNKHHRASSAHAASPAPQQQPDSAARASARESSSSYLTCPNCSASVPSAVINDHLDRCLTGAAGGAAALQRTQHARSGTAAAAAAALQVPPKLAMSLLKDKDLKQKLKQYSLPITGKRQELEQRYGRFRVAVQTALDRGETQASHAEIARRLVARDKQAATAGLPSQVMPKAPRNGTARSDSGNGFNELIHAAKARQVQPSSRQIHDLTGEQATEPAPMQQATEQREKAGDDWTSVAHDPDMSFSNGNGSCRAAMSAVMPGQQAAEPHRTRSASTAPSSGDLGQQANGAVEPHPSSDMEDDAVIADSDVDVEVD